MFGFARDLSIAHMFGASMAADAFFIAFAVPNLVRRIVAEGALSPAIVPVLASLRRHNGEPSLRHVSNALFSMTAVALAVVSGIGVLVSPWSVRLLVVDFWEDPARLQLIITLTQLMWPFLWCIGLTGVAMGVLHALGHVTVPAVAPVLWNIVMISCALGLSPRLATPIYGLAIGVVAGGALQGIVQVPMLRRLGAPLGWAWDWRHPALTRILWLTLPSLFGLAVSELNVLVDRWLAAFLPIGSVSYLYYGHRLVQFPLGIFGTAISVAVLPVLSTSAAQHDVNGLMQSVTFALRLLLFLSVPATCGLIVLHQPIVLVLFERGAFSPSAVAGTATALLYYAVGLCAFAGLKVVVPAFYALQDTRTPVRIGTYALLLNLILSAALMIPMRHGGLALATSLSACFNIMALLVLLRRRLGAINGWSVLHSASKVLGASVVTAALTWWGARWALGAAQTPSLQAMALGGIVLGGLVCYSGLVLILRSAEALFLLEMGRRWWKHR
jgi:putative peptidoglycan lipid II flippase